MFFRASQWLILAFFFLFSTLATLATPPVEDATGIYRIDLNVALMYEDNNPNRWESVFAQASDQIWEASGHRVYVRQVKVFNDCPEVPIEKETDFATKFRAKTDKFDVYIYGKNPEVPFDLRRSFTLGNVFESNGGIVLFEDLVFPDSRREAVGHELCHYVLGLEDEYGEEAVLLGISSQVETAEKVYSRLLEDRSTEGEVLKSDKDSIEAQRKEEPRYDIRTFLVFCEKQFFRSPDACIMDGKGIFNGGGTDYYDGMCTPDTHIKGMVYQRNAAGDGVLALTAQQRVYSKSCTSRASDFFAQHELVVDFSERRGNASKPAPRFKVIDRCRTTAVLLMDKSGSMEGDRIAWVKRAALGVIDSLDSKEDKFKLGIVWFDSLPSISLGIKDISQVKIAAKNAILEPTAGGGTKIAAGLAVALQQIQLLRDEDDEDEDERREVIVLMTDGQSQDDTTAITNAIIDEGIEITVVAIGEELDHNLLFAMSLLSGGGFYQSSEDEDLAFTVSQGLAEDFEGYSLLARQKNDGNLSTEVEVFCDEYIDKLLIQSQLINIDPTDFTIQDVVIESPSGVALPSSVIGGTITADSATLVFQVPAPETGNYKVIFPSKIFLETTSLETVSLGLSNKIQFIANILNPEINEDGEAKAFQYPDPVSIEASLASYLGAVADIEITAFVKRPDGTVIALPLRDEGQPVDGDNLAGDGRYNGLFRNFNADGTYQVEVVASNADGKAFANSGRHTQPGDPPLGVLSRFERIRKFSFRLEGYSEPGDSTLSIMPLGYSLTNSSLAYSETSAYPVGGFVLGGFSASASGSQDVLLKEVPLSLSSDSELLSCIEEIEVYHDSDQDGSPDLTGEYALPIARAQIQLGESTGIVLKDVLVIAPGETLNLLFTGKFRVDKSAPLQEAAASSLVLLLAFFFLPTNKRKRTRLFFIGMLLCLPWISGCGSSFPTISSPAPTVQEGNSGVNLVNQSLTVEIELGNIKASGAIDGNPVPIELQSSEAVKGPTFTAEIPQP